MKFTVCQEPYRFGNCLLKFNYNWLTLTICGKKFPESLFSSKKLFCPRFADDTLRFNYLNRN